MNTAFIEVKKDNNDFALKDGAVDLTRRHRKAHALRISALSDPSPSHWALISGVIVNAIVEAPCPTYRG